MKQCVQMQIFVLGLTGTAERVATRTDDTDSAFIKALCRLVHHIHCRRRIQVFFLESLNTTHIYR